MTEDREEEGMGTEPETGVMVLIAFVLITATVVAAIVTVILGS